MAHVEYLVTSVSLYKGGAGGKLSGYEGRS